MSTSDITATEKRDVYRKVTDANYQLNREWRRNVAYAVAYVRTLCILADQRSEQESVSRYQHRVFMGHCSSEGL